MLSATLSTKEKVIQASQDSIILLGSFLTAMLIGFWAISSYLGPTMGS